MKKILNIQFSRKKLYITALIAAFLIFFHGFGKPHILPWQSSLALNYPVELEARDGRFIVVDDESSRIIFVDSRGRVSKVIAVQELKPSFDVIEGIASDDKYLYLLGYDVKEGGLQITKEHIEKYSLSGRHIKTLYEDIPRQEILRTACSLSDMKVSDGKLYFTEISDDRKTVTAYKISAQDGAESFPNRICAFDSADDIICSAYDVKNDTLIATNMFNEVWLKKVGGGNVVKAKDESSFFPADSKYMAKALKAYRNATAFAENAEEELTPYNLWCHTEQKADGSSGKIYLLRYRQSTISCYDTAKETITVYEKLPVCVVEWLKGFGYWASILLLAFALLKLLRTELKKRFTNGMKYAMAIIAVSAIIIDFYSNALYTQLLEQYKMRISVLCHSVINYTEKNAGEFINNHDRANVQSFCRGKLQRDSVSAVARELAKLSGQASKKDSFFVETYMLGENGQFYTLADSTHFLPTGTPISMERTNYYLSNSIDSGIADYKDDDTGWLEDKDDAGKFLSRCVTERDMWGRVSLMVLCNCCIDNLRTRAVGKAVETFVNLLAFIIAIYVSVTIFITLKAKITTYITNRGQDNTKAAMVLVGPYTFGFYLLYSIDQILMMLVSVKLCGGNMASLALPSLCAGAGALLGKIAVIPLNRAFSNKTLVTGSIAAITLCYVVCDVAVELYSPLLFAVAQFGKYLFWGIADTTIYKMPFSCPRRDLKEEESNSYFPAKNAGTILALLIGGFASALLDYRAMYLLAVGIGVLFSVLLFVSYTDCETKTDETASCSLSTLLKNCFTHEIAAFLILIFLPKAAVGVYGEKIFPSFATLSHLSSLLVSNLAVFDRTSRYIIINRLRKSLVMAKSQAVPIMIKFNIILGLLFAAIWLNGSIFWAIVVLFALDGLAELDTGKCSLYLADMGKKYSISAADMIQLQGVVLGASKFVSAGLFLLIAFGYENACGIIGVIYIACALIFKRIAGKHIADSC